MVIAIKIVDDQIRGSNLRYLELEVEDLTKEEKGHVIKECKQLISDIEDYNAENQE
jgi:hypothetical protein